MIENRKVASRYSNGRRPTFQRDHQSRHRLFAMLDLERAKASLTHDYGRLDRNYSNYSRAVMGGAKATREQGIR